MRANEQQRAADMQAYKAREAQHDPHARLTGGRGRQEPETPRGTPTHSRSPNGPQILREHPNEEHIVSDSPDPSSVFASAADPASDPPTPEEVDVARFNAEVRLMLHGPQREEGREVQRVQVDTLTWVAPEDDLPDEATEEEAAASFNSLFR